VKNSRLVWAALAVAAAGSWSVYATACDKNKSSASAANATTASYQAKTAGAGSCASKNTASAATATTASSSGCAAHTMDATAASHEGCGGSASGVSAVTASTAGAKSMKVAGADGCCSAKSAKSAKNTSASAGGAACGSAMAGISSASCTGQALTMAMCKDSHAGCDACEDMGAFDTELTTAGAAVQVVPIKNGAMFVYTAAAPGKVNALQSAVTRRSEQLQRIIAAGDKAHLCDGCKTMRGAMASGKLHREVVNVERGCMTLITSNDRDVVSKIRSMTGQPVAMR